jgi:hypothetical protein
MKSDDNKQIQVLIYKNLMKVCKQKRDVSTMIKKRHLWLLGHVMRRLEETLTLQVLPAAPTFSRKKKPSDQMKSWHKVVRKDSEPHGGFQLDGHEWDKA